VRGAGKRPADFIDLVRAGIEVPSKQEGFKDPGCGRSKDRIPEARLGLTRYAVIKF
jgi:hypothetical protein